MVIRKMIKFLMPQTKWLIDFISDDIESNDPDLIKSALQQISNKVNQSIANIII
jgi:hypothetical protein